MFIVSKRNIILPSLDGSRAFPISKGYVGEIPDWAAETAYFAELVRDGKIGAPSSKKDKDVTAVEETPVRRRKAEK